MRDASVCIQRVHIIVSPLCHFLGAAKEYCVCKYVRGFKLYPIISPVYATSSHCYLLCVCVSHWHCRMDARSAGARAYIFLVHDFAVCRSHFGFGLVIQLQCSVQCAWILMVHEIYVCIFVYIFLVGGCGCVCVA